MASITGSNPSSVLLALLRPPFFRTRPSAPSAGNCSTSCRPCRIAAEQIRDILHAAVTQLLGFHSRVQPSLFLRKRVIERLHMTYDRVSIRLHQHPPWS